MVEAHPEVMWERGHVGETPIHTCLIYNHHEIANRLIRRMPEVAQLVYEDQPGHPSIYRGESCLHIAVVNNRTDTVKLLLQACPELMYREADGRPPEYVPCYYGCVPLFFAACLGRMSIFELLLEQDPEVGPWLRLCGCGPIPPAAGPSAPHPAMVRQVLFMSDCHANTLLHVLTIHNNLPMTKYVCERMRQLLGLAPGAALPQLEAVNEDGYPPFTLAAFLGKKEIFDGHMRLRMKPLFTYGPVK
eukprot:gene4175-4492_t